MANVNKCRKDHHLKKTEDDKYLACTLKQFLESNFESCMMCDGFYGGNFGQPVCSTCHLFLFSSHMKEDGEEGEDGDNRVYNQKVDSDDSGTEEPGVETDFYASRDVQEREVCQLARRPARHKPDKLAERINALTIPREVDRIPPGLIESLPPEVLLLVFKNLDDISLWVAGNVCTRWRQILDGEITQSKWKHFIQLRWPLFQLQYKVHCWKTIYTQLLLSSPCRYCLESMMLQSTPPIEENSWRHRRLRSELKTLKSDPPEGIQATPLDRHCCHWQASITGPQGSPYEGGLFLLYLQIPQSYPMRPPKVRFITKIFHPNISRHGDVGLDSIHHNWSLALTISKVLISIQSLLTDPYCNICMEPAIGKLFKQNRTQFDRMARLCTWKFAMHDYVMAFPIDPNGV
ncbi:SUMO-conjugating enzyme UBC9 [Biomphalaria pfeifferi]|uniref:E2 ubiquitin-conjugating enzyme n=1 Tax=Biomphalaria pfeifferi TaxID=112525 RepID=A0AAD8B0J5_BIOPF|nr:SUMO-conjugating enzyme UBC9 [Biomphalaria pfeifferi]